MTKKITRGNIVSDRAVLPEYISSAKKNHWSVKTLPSNVTEHMQDSTFAEKYGKKNSVFLTHDKTAYLQDMISGFAGYIERDHHQSYPLTNC